MAVVCQSCGFENPPGMRFCGNCGARLAEGAAPAAQGRAPDQLGVMMGADLRARFQQAGLQSAGQRRNVTVLFADISDYTGLAARIDSEDLYEIVQQYISMLVAAVYKYDGIVDKIVGDGLMALFGAPIAHENNAERAIRAALDMQTGLIALNQDLQARYGVTLQMHIGLNAGVVIVGGVGSDLLMDYTAIGNTVNLAQRLEEAAQPETIFVSESVQRQTARLFDFAATPLLTLKGIADPVQGYRLLGVKAQPGRVRGLEGLHAPMIGRDHEMQQLEALAGALVNQKTGHFALIIGEAGIGKSRLSAELKAGLSGSQVSIFQGQSLTYRRSVAYWIFLDMLRSYLGVTGDAAESEIRVRLVARVEGLLGRRAPEVLAYLEHLLALPPSDPVAAGRLRALDADQLRQQIFIAVRDLLIAEAQRAPVVLFLDDLHWADEASLDLLLFLLDSVQREPLFICGLTRPFEGGQLGQIEERATQRLRERFLSIRLKSLLPAQSEQLFFKLLAIPDLPESLRAEIIQRAAGIPFYLEEILRMLIDDAVIYFEEGRWHLRPDANVTSLGVPDNLQALILARFDHLDPIQRRVLQVAAVIGREFEMAVLSKVLEEILSEQMQVILAHLSARAFIVPRADGAAGEYAFRHVLTSDAIYSTLLRRERSELHGQVGQAIEALYHDRLDEQVYLLARHYSWSAMLDKALKYLIQAGEKAARDYLNLQARDYYQQALELLPRVEHARSQASQLYTGLGDVLVFVGEYDQARERYQAAEALIDSDDPSRIAASTALRRKISTTYERQGDFDQALDHLDAAQYLLDGSELPLPGERVKNLNNIGWIHFRRGELDQANQYLCEALALAEEMHQPEIIASVYNRLGGIYFAKGDLDQAANFVRRSLSLREAMGDIGAVARSYNNLGLLEWKQGRWNAALDSFLRSADLNATLGDIEATIHLEGNIGILYTDRGDLGQAKKYLEGCLEKARQIGHGYLEAAAHLQLARYWLAAKNWQKTLAYCEQSETIFQSLGSTENAADLHWCKGEAWLGSGDVEKADRICQEILALMRAGELSSQPSTELGRVVRLQGKVAQARRQFDLAAQLFDESLRHFRALDDRLELGRTIVLQAFLAIAQGHQEIVPKLISESRRIFAELGARLDLRELDDL